MVALRTAPLRMARSSVCRRNPVVRVQMPTYGADGHCACMPTRRSITAVAESRFRSNSSCRARVARFSSRSVRVRSAMCRRLPLGGEHREHELVAPVALEELVLYEVRLLPHAQPSHESGRGVVARVAAADDPVELEDFE